MKPFKIMHCCYEKIRSNFWVGRRPTQNGRMAAVFYFQYNIVYHLFLSTFATCAYEPYAPYATRKISTKLDLAEARRYAIYYVF